MINRLDDCNQQLTSDGWPSAQKHDFVRASKVMTMIVVVA
jgi:hypothetical protein